MNTVNARRWRNFKSNRRGYVSFIVFMVLFVIALGAEFIANDRPILVMKGGELYLPVRFDYSEQALGGELPTLADYRVPYVIDLIESDGWMLWPPVRFGFDTVDWEIDRPLPAPPGSRSRQ